MTSPELYAPVAGTVEGSQLRAAGGFTCMQRDRVYAVQADRDGDLFITCRAGRHYLDGQDEQGRLVGLYAVPLS